MYMHTHMYMLMNAIHSSKASASLLSTGPGKFHTHLNREMVELYDYIA